METMNDNQLIQLPHVNYLDQQTRCNEGCLDLETTCFQQHDGQINLHHRHGPLLYPRVALAISRGAMAARLSLRFAGVLTDTAAEALRMSTTAYVGLTRRSLTNVIANAYELRNGLPFSPKNISERFVAS
jgi:hypothetical protein